MSLLDAPPTSTSRTIARRLLAPSWSSPGSLWALWATGAWRDRPKR